MYTPSQTSSYRSAPEAWRSSFSRSSTIGSKTRTAMAVFRLRELQFFRPHRHGVDRVLDFFQRADAAADEIVVGDGAGAGAGGFALHDRAGLEARLGAVELRLGDALAEAVQFGDEAVERLLRALVAGARVAQDAALALQGRVAG